MRNFTAWRKGGHEDLKKWTAPGVLILVLLLALPGMLSAQVARGAITGVVKDQSGAVIPGAAVTVINERTGAEVNAHSQANGVYQALQLLVGDYTVSVEAPGFKRLSIRGLKVDVNSTLTQDLSLEVGTVTESVMVTGETNLVQTTSGQVGSLVTINQVLEIPLQDRNVFNLVNLVPGAFGLNYGEAPQNAWFLNVSLGGGRFTQTVPLVDGVTATQSGANMHNIDLSPPVDSMQEFRVEINSLSAEFGRSTGGVINAVTKNGTNEFHGSLYEFLRNNIFDAYGWGNDTKPPLKRNIFGGTLGGPIKKNSTFFFYNYDGLRSREAVNVTRNVGLPEWKTGDFSTAMRQVGSTGVPLVIYDPETGTGTFEYPMGTTPFPGNVIPAARLDPVASKVLNSYVPGANRVPNNTFTQAGNWQAVRVPMFGRDYHTIRLDHEFNERTKAFGRYIRTGPEGRTVEPMEGWGDGDPDTIRQSFERQNVALNVTHLFSPTFFLSYTMGVHRFFQHNKNGPYKPGTDWGSVLGIPNTHGEVFPQFQISGGNLPYTNLGVAEQVFISETNWNFVANFTKVKGNHTLKFGVQHDRLGGNRGAWSTNGQWGFDGHFTQGVSATGTPVPNTGSRLSDFLLGRVNSVAARFHPSQGLRMQVYSGYIQDDWRVSPRLTLNIGLRYDTETPLYEVNNRFSNLDPYPVNPLAGTGDIPAGATGIVRFQNRHGEGKYLYDWNKKSFGPRFGFAYRLGTRNNTAIRGGYGIFFSRSSADLLNAETLVVPWKQSYDALNPVPFRLRDGLPVGALSPVPESELAPTFGTRGTRFAQPRYEIVEQHYPTPYSQNFNLTIQHQTLGMLIETGYLGNLARHARAPNPPLNLIPPDQLSNIAVPARLRRPFTIFASDEANVRSWNAHFGLASYHAFILKLERRLRDGFSWTVSYTLSKTIDNVNQTSTTGATVSGDNSALQFYHNRDLEKSLSTNHIPHRLVVSPIIELPVGKGRRWLNQGGVLNAVLGGWQVSTFATLQSGSPFGASVQNGPQTYLGDRAAPMLRPNLVGPLESPNKGEPAVGVRGIEWLNPASLAAPGLYTYGNASRTLPGILGPGMVNFDTMVGKNFKIGESVRLQFRWETFNTTNTPKWGLPARAVGGNDLGIITGAGSRRLMQFGLKLYW